MNEPQPRTLVLMLLVVFIITLTACTAPEPSTPPSQWRPEPNQTVSYPGGAQINDTRRPCTEEARGTLRFDQRGANTSDALELCVQNSTGGHEYVEVTP